MASENPPKQIIGNYTLLDELGKGAFAHVYSAQDNQSGKYVAIKLLNEKHYNAPGEEDLRREGEFLKRLLEFHSPYILTFIEQAEWDGRPYIVIQLLRKGTLRAQLKGEPIEVGRAKTIITQIGKAVSTIHRQDIVHCDISPENILFNENDEAILTDFGIAIQLPTDSNLVTISLPRGTPLYMAPEQFRGIITKQSDQYSLGCIAYELFTGTHPVESITSLNINNMNIMEVQHNNKPPVDPCKLNVRLEGHIGEATLKAIAKTPEERYKDVDTFINALSYPRTSPATTGSYGRQVQVRSPTEVTTDLHLPEGYFSDFLALLKWVGYHADPRDATRSEQNERRYTLVWQEGREPSNYRALIYIPEEILDKPSRTHRDSITSICTAFDKSSIDEDPYKGFDKNNNLLLIIVSKLPGYVDGEIRRIIDEDWLAQGKKGKILPWRDIDELIKRRTEVMGTNEEQKKKKIIKKGIERLLEIPE